ncbi:MAG: 2-oxoacid:acceptor oxidoreductase subunit alpha [Candidatus Aminicenantaceae bacterium]
MIRDISVMIAGKAGDGVLFTGNVLAKILKRSGWEVVTYRDFPSNIRGEPTNFTIRASLKKIYGRSDYIDVLIAFDCESILEHRKVMAEEGVILCDGEDLDKAYTLKAGKITHHPFALKRLAREHFRSEIYKNMIAQGALCYILGLDFGIVKEVISEIFLEKKGRDVVEKNINAVNLGFKESRKIIDERNRHFLLKKEDKDRLILSGDEAIALGALGAGCRLFAAYPICPASEIWQWLAVYMPRFNGVVVQTEDEIAALNMVLGASYAGVRSMTSTSGPGASLMMEAFGLAGIAEIPVVVAHVQRTGPSTGMPTKTEQGDLNQWLYGSHGEFPRIILAPGTVEECFEFTCTAFNLAEKYQCPVIILTEQDYGQNLRTVKKFDLSKVKIERGKLLTQEELLKYKDYKRYEFTPSGVSPRAIPSQKNGIHMIEGNEHDERGYRNEDAENRVKMMEKRMRKLKSASREVISPKVWGEEETQIGILGFGSTLGPIQESMKQLKKEGIKAKFLQLRTLWPFPSQKVNRFIEKHRLNFVVENNYTGQLSTLIKSQVKPTVEVKDIRKYSSDSFKPSEISAGVKRFL